MADGFKIADAFVEVEVDLDKRQITRASVEAGHESGKGFTAGFGRSQKGKDGAGRGLVGSVTKSLGGLVGAAGKIGAKAGGALVSGLTSATETLVSSLPKALSNPYVLTAVVAAATTVGVFAGAALNGAILGALGTGVVAAGIALAAKDPRVEKEAVSLGDFLLSGLISAASSFVAPVRQSIRNIRSEFRDMLPDIQGIFREASQYVAPLTSAVTGFVRNILPGIKAAVANLQPIFDVLSRKIPDLGRVLGNDLEYLSENAEGAAAGLEVMFNTLEWGIHIVTATLATLSQMVRFVQWAGEGIDNLLSSDDETTVLAIRRVDTATQDLTRSTEEVVDETKTFIAVLNRLNETAINAIDTEGAYQKAIDDVARAKKEEHAVLVMTNGVLVQNTEAQRAGAAAINEVAKAALAKAAAVHEATLKTGTMAQADAAARASIIKSREEFIKLAEKLGLSAAAAKKLADELLGIPKNVTTVVTTKYVKVDGGYQLSDDNGPRGHAAGGLIRGEGTGTSDSIVRRVSDGEYVIRAAAVKRMGVRALDAINSGGQAAPAAGGSTAVMDRPAPAARPPIIVNMAGANFYGVGTADKYVADLYDAIDRYEKRYR